MGWANYTLSQCNGIQCWAFGPLQ